MRDAVSIYEDAFFSSYVIYLGGYKIELDYYWVKMVYETSFLVQIAKAV